MINYLVLIVKKLYRRASRQQHLKSQHCQLYQQLFNNVKDTIFSKIPNPQPLNDNIVRPYYNDDNKIVYLTDKQYKFYKKLGAKKYSFRPA